MMRLRSIAAHAMTRAQERGAGRARALGMELRAGHAALADEAREPAAVDLGRGQHGSARPASWTA